MKTIVMMRGPDPARSDAARLLLERLNADSDNVRGFMIEASKWMGRGTGPEDASAAYTTCKNYFKKFMLHMNEPVSVVNNPNERPDTWRSYQAITGDFPEPHTFVGVQVGKPSEAFVNDMDVVYEIDGSAVLADEIEEISKKLFTGA